MITLRPVFLAVLLGLALPAGPARAMDIPDLVFPENAITRVMPAAASPGARITILGVNFVPGARVWIGGAEASDVQVVSPQELVATVPPHAPGRASVQVRLPMFRSATRGWAFTYLAPPADGDTSP